MRIGVDIGGTFTDLVCVERELVRRDVACGFISTGAARNFYGLEDGE